MEELSVLLRYALPTRNTVKPVLSGHRWDPR